MRKGIKISAVKKKNITLCLSGIFHQNLKTTTTLIEDIENLFIALSKRKPNEKCT